MTRPKGLDLRIRREAEIMRDLKAQGVPSDEAARIAAKWADQEIDSWAKWTRESHPEI